LIHDEIKYCKNCNSILNIKRFDGSLIENSPELIAEKIIKELC